MLEKLHEKILEVTFTKVNGDTRVMVCTLIPDFLPPTSGASGGYEGLTTVFDLENDGWRSFRTDSVIDVKEYKEAWPMENKCEYSSVDNSSPNS